jgi:hypothetical protein
VGRHFVHTLSAAGGAEAAFFTGVRHKAFVLTSLTPEPSKPVSQNPTAKIGFDFLINMGRKGASIGILLRGHEESLEILLNRAIENRPFRLMPEIGSRKC